jgi:hypothetical protein
MSAHHEFWVKVGDFVSATWEWVVTAIAAVGVIAVVVVVLSEVLGVW